jgi:hypothetical protein
MSFEHCVALQFPKTDAGNRKCQYQRAGQLEHSASSYSSTVDAFMPPYCLRQRLPVTSLTSKS